MPRGWPWGHKRPSHNPPRACCWHPPIACRARGCARAPAARARDQATGQADEAAAGGAAPRASPHQGPRPVAAEHSHQGAPARGCVRWGGGARCAVVCARACDPAVSPNKHSSADTHTRTRPLVHSQTHTHANLLPRRKASSPVAPRQPPLRQRAVTEQRGARTPPGGLRTSWRCAARPCSRRCQKRLLPSWPGELPPPPRGGVAALCGCCMLLAPPAPPRESTPAPPPTRPAPPQSTPWHQPPAHIVGAAGRGRPAS